MCLFRGDPPDFVARLPIHSNLVSQRSAPPVGPLGLQTTNPQMAVWPLRVPLPDCPPPAHIVNLMEPNVARHEFSSTFVSGIPNTDPLGNNIVAADVCSELAVKMS